MKVSAITLTYNGLEVLKKCLESTLEKNKNVEFEWLIRENGSKDGSKEYLEDIATKHPQLRIFNMANDGNFSKMNNDLAKECKGEYVLFLNNDVEALSPYIEIMAEYLDKDPSIGGLGAVLYYPNNTIQHCGIVFESNCTAHNISTYYQNLRGLSPNLHKHDRVYQAATGACFMMRLSDWQAIGLFDEKYNWCYDDVDLSLKISHKLNKKIVVPAKATLYHYESYSKANPNVYSAVTRLQKDWRDIFKLDVFNYTIDINRYYLP